MDKEWQIRLNFLEEAEEYFDIMESNLLGLGESEVDSKKVDLVLRAAHSVKGGAAMMGFLPLSRTAHRIEDFLKILRVRYSGQSIEVAIETLLLRSVDALRKIASVNHQGQDCDENEFAQNTQPLFEKLQEYLGELDDSDEDALMSQNEDVDPALLLFEDGVESVLAEFESSIQASAPEEFASLLSATAQELIAFGNMANLTAFCQLCQSVDSLAQQIPNDAIPDLTHRALKAWKRSHSLVLRGSIDKLPSCLEGYDTSHLQGQISNFETALDNDSAPSGLTLQDVIPEVARFDIADIDLNSFGPSPAEDETLSSNARPVESFDLLTDITSNEFDVLQSAFGQPNDLELSNDAGESSFVTPALFQSTEDPDQNSLDESVESLLDLDDLDLALVQNAFADASQADISLPPLGEVQSVPTEQLSIEDEDSLQSPLPSTSLPDPTKRLLENISQRLKLDPAILYSLIAQKNSTQSPQDATESQATPVVDKMVRVPSSQLKQFNTLFEQLILNRNSINLKLQQFQNTIQLMEKRIAQIETSNTQLKQWYDRASLEGFLNESSVGISLSRSISNDREQFDSLEMDRYSDIHLICQAQIETIVQLQEVAADIQLGLSDIHQSVDALNYTTQSMQGNVTRTQMIPFKEVVKRCPRIIRDLNLQYDKQVSLKILGESTLLDRRVAEVLNDPLMHLLRNAFDHGIEEAESRIQQGKDPRGQITIQASNQGTYTVVTIQDDGAGLPIDKIKDRIVQMGIPRSDVDKLPHADLLEFIFEPGFSTAERVTELSGRGVGMDVVKTNLDEIQGNIRVSSEPGQGTTFTIRIPYTLSILRVAVVEQDGMIFAIPANSMEEMFAFNSRSLCEDSEILSLNWMDRQLPVIEMEKTLTFNRPHQKFRLPGTPTIDEPMAIVVKNNQRHAALKISRFWYEQESTIRSIDSPIPLPTGMISSVVFGDGRVIPLIDPGAIIDPYLSVLGDPNRDVTEQDASMDSLSQTHSILIVDDSINVRRYLAHTLEKAGYRVEQAKDGQDAVDRLMDGLSVNAVVCDIEMPRLDGYGFLEEIKGQAQFDDLPVVMLTSRSNEKHRRIAMNLGATDYFSKPYNETELLSRLSELTQTQVLTAIMH